MPGRLAFSVRGEVAVLRQVPLDLGAMNDLAGRSFDKPVFLQEAGYRSDDAELGPPYVHENLQDLFFQELYSWWTVRNPIDETRYLLANGVLDSCTLATLGVGLEGEDPSFVRQHLCSLGLVSQADFPENPFAPKPAFHTFEAISEGFNPRLRCGSNASCSYGGDGVCRRDGLCVCDEAVCPQGQVCRSPGVCG